MPGASSTSPLVFVSHLDAAGTEAVAADSPHEMPISVPLSRAHVVALLEALEGLLGEGYQPGGDLLLALSMDGLSGGGGRPEHRRAPEGAQPVALLCAGPRRICHHGGVPHLPAQKRAAGADRHLRKGRDPGRDDRGPGGEQPPRPRTRPPRGRAAARGRASHAPSAPARLCAASETMLSELGKKAPLLQRWLVRRPRVTFPLMRVLWRKRSVFHQFFVSEAHGMRPERAGYAPNPGAGGVPHLPPDADPRRTRGGGAPPHPLPGGQR